MIEKVLVPVDGSAFAESALPMALAVAAKAGADIRLAMVSEPANLPPGAWAEAFLENHAKYLDSVTQSVEERAAEGVGVSSTLLEGEVPKAVVGEASAWGADLLVMSTHGHGGLARVWLGSVADAVLRESPAPVLLVRPTEAPEEAPEGEERPPSAPDSFHRVVVTLDGTPFAEQVIGPALELGRLFDASFTLLRAVPYPVMVSSYLPDTVAQNDAFIRQSEELAQAYLEDVRARLGDASIEIAVIVSPTPAAGVLEHVQESGADLVAMASHGRRGLARAALGSIADKVVRGAYRPVLIVHPTESA